MATKPKEGQIVFVAGGVAQYRGGIFYTGMEDPRYERPIKWPVEWWLPLSWRPASQQPEPCECPTREAFNRLLEFCRTLIHMGAVETPKALQNVMAEESARSQQPCPVQAEVARLRASWICPVCQTVCNHDTCGACVGKHAQTVIDEKDAEVARLRAELRNCLRAISDVTRAGFIDELDCWDECEERWTKPLNSARAALEPKEEPRG